MVTIVFRSRLRANANLETLETYGARMYELASAMPGFVSYKDFAADDGESLVLVKFESEATLLNWRNHPEHLTVQAKGQTEYFSEYSVEVLKTTRAYQFTEAAGRTDVLEPK